MGGLCDSPFTVSYAALSIGCDPLGHHEEHAECSGGIYDKRWWLNELVRAAATRQPNKVFPIGVPGPNAVRPATLIRPRPPRIKSFRYLCTGARVFTWWWSWSIADRDSLERTSRISDRFRFHHALLGAGCFDRGRTDWFSGRYLECNAGVLFNPLCLNDFDVKPHYFVPFYHLLL